MSLALPVGEVMPTDVELNLLEAEPPGLFPTNQDSYWGTLRKVFADWLQDEILDAMDIYYNSMAASSCGEDDMDQWETMLGIPVDGGERTVEQRRSFVLSRLLYGAFTRSHRAAIVESFITATFGPVVAFDSLGVELTSAGVPLFAETVIVSSSYRIVENVSDFSYEVRILNTIALDTDGLTRELLRYTPAGIVFTITMTPTP